MCDRQRCDRHPCGNVPNRLRIVGCCRYASLLWPVLVYRCQPLWPNRHSTNSKSEMKKGKILELNRVDKVDFEVENNKYKPEPVPSCELDAFYIPAPSVVPFLYWSLQAFPFSVVALFALRKISSQIEPIAWCGNWNETRTDKSANCMCRKPQFINFRWMDGLFPNQFYIWIIPFLSIRKKKSFK